MVYGFDVVPTHRTLGYTDESGKEKKIGWREEEKGGGHKKRGEGRKLAEGTKKEQEEKAVN